ncbi:uncharacterized protein [Musca autumnalis]|uniref:uncharacterized protein n=1 Tax=Musca autumnalis TaxID=221902 RepID=UPI003CEEF08F
MQLYKHWKDLAIEFCQISDLHMSNHISSVHCCPWCNKEFKSSYNLNIHQKKEHPREWKEERQKTIESENIRCENNVLSFSGLSYILFCVRECGLDYDNSL